MQTEGTAIAALVLAILSFVVCPLLPALLALDLAGRADQKITDSAGTLTGEQLTKAARVVAGANIGLCMLFLAVLAIGAIPGGGARSGPVRSEAPAVPQPIVPPQPAVPPSTSGR
ncbi:MAG TPA: hypothetical protein VK988_14105 [Acidimicrobiales bacterium]|nr:hypothetical protein [Acidimicrobiales bacterium]